MPALLVCRAHCCCLSLCEGEEIIVSHVPALYRKACNRKLKCCHGFSIKLILWIYMFPLSLTEEKALYVA